jgi:hypothetical protein
MSHDGRKKNGGAVKCQACGREVRGKRCLYCGGVPAGGGVTDLGGGTSFSRNEEVTVEGADSLTPEMRKRMGAALGEGKGESRVEKKSTMRSWSSGKSTENAETIPREKILRLLEEMQKAAPDGGADTAFRRKMAVELVLEAMKGMGREERTAFAARDLGSSDFAHLLDEATVKEIVSRILSE